MRQTALRRLLYTLNDLVEKQMALTLANFGFYDDTTLRNSIPSMSNILIHQLIIWPNFVRSDRLYRTFAQLEHFPVPRGWSYALCTIFPYYERSLLWQEQKLTSRFRIPVFRVMLNVTLPYKRYMNCVTFFHPSLFTVVNKSLLVSGLCGFGFGAKHFTSRSRHVANTDELRGPFIGGSREATRGCSPPKNSKEREGSHEKRRREGDGEEETALTIYRSTDN